MERVWQGAYANFGEKKESSLDAVVRTIQTFGLTRNKLLSHDEVMGAINRLIDPG